MSKTLEHFFKPVGGNDISSPKAVHAAAVLAAQKETEQAFAKIKTQNFVQLAIRENFVSRTFPRIRYTELPQLFVTAILNSGHFRASLCEAFARTILKCWL